MKRNIPKLAIVTTRRVNDQKGHTPTETNGIGELMTLPSKTLYKRQVWWHSEIVRSLFSPFLIILPALIGAGRNLNYRDVSCNSRRSDIITRAVRDVAGISVPG